MIVQVIVQVTITLFLQLWHLLLFPPLSLSYLLQVEVFNRHDVSAGSQDTHHGGQHSQQWVLHGFSFELFASPQQVKQVSEWGCKEIKASGGSLYPVPCCPIPPPPPICLLLLLPCFSITKKKKSVAFNHRLANYRSYTTGTCGWKRGWEEGGVEIGCIIGFF